MDELVNRKDFCIFILMYLIDIMKIIISEVFFITGQDWRMERLLDAYKRILQEVDAQSHLNLNDDKYSGVFFTRTLWRILALTGKNHAGWTLKPLAGIRWMGRYDITDAGT